MKKMTPQEFLLTLVGGLFAPPIVIILIIVYIMGIQGSHVWAGSSETEGRAVRERSQPFGVAVVINPKASPRSNAAANKSTARCALPDTPLARWIRLNSRTLPHGASASGL